MPRTLAWHGDPGLKAEVLGRMIRHREHDEIVQGPYQRPSPNTPGGFRGSAIGCALPPQPYGREPYGGWHELVETEYGIPRAVGLLIDRIFENLPPSGCAGFAVDSIEAIRVRADLSLVASRLMLDLLNDQGRGVWRLAAEGSARRAAVDSVIELYRCRLAGDEPAGSEWRDAARVADDVADLVVDDDAYAAFAAYTAATYAAADSLDAAADSLAAADDAAVRADAYDHFWPWVSGRLLHHLRTAPLG